jgi:hypothetical protein
MAGAKESYFDWRQMVFAQRHAQGYGAKVLLNHFLFLMSFHRSRTYFSAFSRRLSQKEGRK